jgi:hypothetical protein
MLTLTLFVRVEVNKTNTGLLESCLDATIDGLLICATAYKDCHRKLTFKILNELLHTMSAVTTFINDNGLRIYKNPNSVDVPKVDLPTLLFGTAYIRRVQFQD